ncbi:MAG: NHLP bacteriocin system secretion protein [Planctomycetaceae bacterium]|jgi:HlyD family secretion protein|nr:NHLP bacteriocin system secretion protein [Planctomycetaceae bacterium]
MSVSETKPGLFRNEAEKCYGSPEKLDESIHLISRFEWLLLLAGCLICAVLLWWGLFGTIDVRVNGVGILAFPEGTPSVSSKVAGIVDKIYVKLEQKVTAGDLIAYVYQSDLDIREQTLQKELDEYISLHERLKTLETTNLKDSLSALNNQKKQLEQSIETTNKQNQIYQEQQDSYQRLYEKGIVSKQDLDKAGVTLLNGQLSLKSLQNQIQSLLKSISDINTGYHAAIQQRELNISNKKNEILQLQHQREEDGNLYATHDGVVCEISVAQGERVNVNQTVILIDVREQKQDSNESIEIEAIVFVSSVQAKKIRSGQQSLISPTIVRPSQYGSIKGQVLFVSDYPATPARLDSLFPNSTLDEQLLAQGSVFEVHLQLEKSNTSPSGYHWTSGMGPPVRLTVGTMTNAMICVEQRRPISYLLPFIEQFFLGVDNYGVYGK